MRDGSQLQTVFQGYMFQPKHIKHYKHYPEKHLITLVNFVMKVYVPMWFEIKANPYVASGARNILKAISLVKQQSYRRYKTFSFQFCNEMHTFLIMKMFSLPCSQMKIQASENWLGEK